MGAGLFLWGWEEEARFGFYTKRLEGLDVVGYVAQLKESEAVKSHCPLKKPGVKSMQGLF